jgi:Domain of unknown function (DUF1707)
MSSEHPPGPPIRASHAEREAAVGRLRDAASEGRLTLEELADRTGAALEATDRADLDRLVADLPGDRPLPAPAPERGRRWFLGILGGATLRGPLRLAGRCTIVNFMGGVDLDLSGARLEGDGVTLRIVSVMGGSTIRVPDGVRVDWSGFSLMGGDDLRDESEPPPPPEAPVVRIRSFNLMSGNNLRRSSRRR